MVQKKKALSVAGIKAAAAKKFANVQVEAEIGDDEVLLEFRQVVRLSDEERDEWVELTNETVSLVEKDDEGNATLRDGQKETIHKFRRQMLLIATDESRENVETVLDGLDDHEVIAFYSAVLTGVVDEGE